MAKPEWGSKHRCTSCGAKFYDFHKKTLICPKCNADVQPEVLLRSRRTSAPEERKVVAPKVVEKVEAEAETDTDTNTDTNTDTDEDTNDDAVLLDGDDSDVGAIDEDDDNVEGAVAEKKPKADGP